MHTTLATHQERAHAERSASQLGSLVRCPGYRPKPSDKVHWVTAQGTRGHVALDSNDDSGLESTFEQRMVKLARDYCETLPAASREFQEVRVNTIEGRWGFTDRLRIRARLGVGGTLEDSDEADLLDWKFVKSKRVVDAEHNLQGKDYILGIFDDPQFAFLNTIHVHFVEVRFGEASVATFTRADIPRLRLEVFAVLARARETDRTDYDGSTLVPDYSTCAFCGAAGNCVALRRIADTVARAYDPDGYGTSPAVPSETHAARVTDPVALGQLQSLASLMDTFSREVRGANLARALDDPKMVPAGYAVDWAQGRRRVTSPDALRTVCEEFGLTVSDLIESATLSWTKVEALIRDRAPRGGKAVAVERFSERLLEAGAADRDEPTPQLRRNTK